MLHILRENREHLLSCRINCMHFFCSSSSKHYLIIIIIVFKLMAIQNFNREGKKCTSFFVCNRWIVSFFRLACGLWKNTQSTLVDICRWMVEILSLGCSDCNCHKIDSRVWKKKKIKPRLSNLRIKCRKISFKTEIFQAEKIINYIFSKWVNWKVKF